MEADFYWRQRNCVGVYFSRCQRRSRRQGERCKRATKYGQDCVAAAAAKGGLGEPLVVSEVRAPNGCNPIDRGRYPVVALKDARL